MAILPTFFHSQRRILAYQLPLATETTQDLPVPDVSGQNYALRNDLQTITKSLDGLDPLRESLQDLSKDHAVFEQRVLDLDSLFVLYTIARSHGVETRLVASKSRLDDTLAKLSCELDKARASGIECLVIVLLPNIAVR